MKFRKYVLTLAIITAIFLFTACLDQQESSKSSVIVGKTALSGKKEPGDSCENYTPVECVCPTEICPPTITCPPTTLPKSANLISVKRCFGGRCIEAKIPEEFDFLSDQCEKDQDCYDLICYRPTTPTTTTLEEACEEACEDFDCPSNTQYVGSKKTNFYYCCASECAEKIPTGYIVCLKSAEDAFLHGFEPAPYYFCE